MSLVFFGTPQWAVPALEALAGSPFAPALVVSQPRKRRGRGSAQTASPVASAASRLGLTVAEPASVRAPAFLQQVRALSPDLFVVVAFGRIFSPELLEVPRLGCVNLHFSLLPRYRGAAPVQWAIARGESETGVTTMRMAEELDAGPIYLQKTIPIAPDEHAPQLGERLARAGAELLGQTVAGLWSGSLTPREQDHALASFASRIRAEEGRIDWSSTAPEIVRRVRAFDPWPGQWTGGRKGTLRVMEARSADDHALGLSGAGPPPTPSPSPPPGLVLGARNGALLVTCGKGTTLAISRIQPAGKRPMSGAEALRGRHVAGGERLGAPDAAKS